MAVVLDTTHVPVRDRRDVLVTSLREVSGSSRVVLEDEASVDARLDLWTFGAAAIFRTESNGITMTRTAKAASDATASHIAIGLHESGTAHHRIGSSTRVVRAGEALVVDVTRPFDYAWRGRGAAQSLNVPAEYLALPADVVRRASTRLPSSPLYRLVCRHIADLTRHADELSSGPMAHSLGTASIELARALVGTAADDTSTAREVVEQTLVTQVRAYVRQHLRDPGLTPESVAAALAVSPRQLYRACANAGLRLEQWIIAERLAHARSELTRPGVRHRSIAMVASMWGFKDPTHFTRRFRAAYGLLPSEWRREAAQPSTSTQPPDRQ